MNDAPLKKQVIYAGFVQRIFASLIDLMLSFILLLPVIAISSTLIYGDISPNTVLMPVAKEIFTELNPESKPISSSLVAEALPRVFADPRVREYFVNQGGLVKIAIDQLFQLTIYGVIIIAFWTYRSATPGKMFMSIKIVDAKTFEKLTFKQELIRFFGYFVSTLPLGLGIVWIAFNKKGQAFHDKMAGSVVIKK